MKRVFTFKNAKGLFISLLNNIRVRVRDLSNVHKGGGVVDFNLLFTQTLSILLSIFFVITYPVSVWLVLYLDYFSEKSYLKWYVKWVRKDKRFFTKYYYIELRNHIAETKQNYNYF